MKKIGFISIRAEGGVSRRLRLGMLIALFLRAGVFCQEKNDIAKINAGILSGPSCVPICKMLENPEFEDVKINFEKFATPQNLLPKFIKKEIDVGFLPVNVAAKFFNASNKSVACLAVTGNGNIFLITTDRKTNKISDLIGEKIQVAGQGATPDFLFRYILRQNEIEIGKKGVVLDFSVPNSQIVAQLISGKVDYAVVPEPFVSIAKTKSKKIRAVVDFQKEYEFFSEKKQNYPLTVLVARKNFAQENPQLIEKFLREYEKSLNWTLENPTAAGKLCEKLNFGLNANVVEKSIPNANYVFERAIFAKDRIEEFLNILAQSDSDSPKKEILSADFYFDFENENVSGNTADGKND